MIVPNGFLPSSRARAREYDSEGRLREFNISRTDQGGIGESNSRYATQAELFSSCAPHLKAAKMKDALRRNYIIQPGGAAIYFDPEERLADPYDYNRVQFNGPDSVESFGHGSMDGTKMVAPAAGLPTPTAGR